MFQHYYAQIVTDHLRPNSITLSSLLAGRRPASESARSSRAGSLAGWRSGIWQLIPLHYIARDLARELVRELVCDLLWLNSITLCGSQTWFPTCRRQVRPISTCRDSSNLVVYRFRPYSITLSCSATSSPAGRRPAFELVASWIL